MFLGWILYFTTILFYFTNTIENYFVNYIKRESKDTDHLSEVYIFKDVVLGQDLSITAAYFDFSFNLLNNLKLESLQLLYQCTVEKLDQLKSLNDCSQNTTDPVGPYNIKLFLSDFNFTKKTNQHFIFLFKIRFLTNETYKTIKKSIRSTDRLVLFSPNEPAVQNKSDKNIRSTKTGIFPPPLITNSLKNNPLEIINIPKLVDTSNILNPKYKFKRDIRSTLKTILNDYFNSLIKQNENPSPVKSNISKLFKFKNKFRNSLDFLAHPTSLLNSPTNVNNNESTNEKKKIMFSNSNNLTELKTYFEFKVAVSYNIYKLKDDIQNIHTLYFNLFKLGKAKFFEYNDYLKGINDLIKDKIMNLNDKQVDELLIKINYEKLNRLINNNIIVEKENNRRPSLSKTDSFYKIEPKSASKKKFDLDNNESLNNTVIEKEENMHGKSVFGKMYGNTILNTDLYTNKDFKDNKEGDENFNDVEEFVNVTNSSEHEKNDIMVDEVNKVRKLYKYTFDNKKNKSKRNSKLNSRRSSKLNNKLMNKLNSKEIKDNKKNKENNEENNNNNLFIVGLILMITSIGVVVMCCYAYKPLSKFIENWTRKDYENDKVGNKENEYRKKNLEKDMNVPKKDFMLKIPSI